MSIALGNGLMAGCLVLADCSPVEDLRDTPASQIGLQRSKTEEASVLDFHNGA